MKSISNTVETWAEVRFESTMCSAVFFRIGDIGTTWTRGVAAGDGGPRGGRRRRGHCGGRGLGGGQLRRVGERCGRAGRPSM